MEHIIVQDHQLASIAYDAQSSTLQILFKRGGLYEYYQVPAESYAAIADPGRAGYFSHSQPEQPSHYRAFEALIKRTGIKYNRLGNSLPTSGSSGLPFDPVFDAPKGSTPNQNKVASVPSGSNRHDTAPLTITEAPAPLPAEAETVKKKSDDIVVLAQAITVFDAATQIAAGETLKTVAALQTEIETTFKPMKEAAFRAHRVICGQETALLAPLRAAEATLKNRIGAFVVEQNRLARAEEERLRKIEKDRADAEAKVEADRQALEQAYELEQRGNLPAAAAVLERPAPVPSTYRAPAAVAPAVADTKGVGVRMAWTGMRIINESLIPREWLMVNETAIRKVGKDTQGKVKIPGVEFFEEPTVSTSRRG